MKRPKPSRRPARAPAFVCFRQLRELASRLERRSSVLDGLGRPDEGLAWLECAQLLSRSLNFLEGK